MHRRWDRALSSPQTSPFSAAADAAWARKAAPQGAAFPRMWGGQPGVSPPQPVLLKLSDAKSVPASQRSAFGPGSPHLDTITEPSGEWEKAITMHFTTSCCLFTRGPSYPAQTDEGG